MSQVPGLDGYWWGGNVELLSEEFLSRKLQKLTLNFTKMMKFSASVWEDNKMRWEEQRLQLKEELLKGKMQKKSMKTLQGNTFIGSWDLASSKTFSRAPENAWPKVVPLKIL